MRQAYGGMIAVRGSERFRDGLPRDIFRTTAMSRNPLILSLSKDAPPTGRMVRQAHHKRGVADFANILGT